MRPVLAILAVACVCALASQATAQPNSGTQRIAQAPQAKAKAKAPAFQARYLATRHRFVDAFGLAAAGRNLVRDGYLPPSGPARATPRARVEQSTDYMRSALNPPEPAAPAVASSAVPATSTSSGGYSIPSYIVECESGGDYSAVNPSSGAFGAYQIMPATWQASCSDLSQDPAGQDECAARLYASSGTSPWDCA